MSEIDTDKPSGYLENYRRWFTGMSDQPVRILELGIQRGGSLLMWAEWFPNGQVTGLDLNPSPVADTDRIQSYRGFQQDPAALDRIAAERGPFDIIIDDASHIGAHTSAAFWHLFPNHLRPGGLYVLDDWSCAYWPYWTDGHALEEPAIHRRWVREGLMRRARRLARPVAQRLSPGMRARVGQTFTAAERASVQRRFPNHDYGMAGVVKQLIDHTAADVARALPGEGRSPRRVGMIERMEITVAQVLVVRTSSAS